jgi:hypothetical protein
VPIRFRRTFRLLPGVRINVSKHGISTTVGPRGMHLTFNRYGVRQAVGLPGTGLSEYGYIIGGNRAHASENSSERAEDEAERHVRSIHHGEGIGCMLPGLGCLTVLVLLVGAGIYFGADALNLHPATYLAHLPSDVAHSLSLWARKNGL